MDITLDPAPGTKFVKGYKGVRFITVFRTFYRITRKPKAKHKNVLKLLNLK